MQIAEGKIVEFIENERFVCALCIGKKTGKIRVLTADNREQNLSPNRIILVSKKTVNLSRPREELLSFLKKEEEERERLKKEVNVKELWELLKDEEENFSNEELAQLVFGEKSNDVHVSALVRALFEDRVYFKFKNKTFIPNPEDKVQQIIRQREEERIKKQKIEKGSRWLRDIIEGRETEKPDFAEGIIEGLEKIYIFGREADDYEFTHQLLVKAGISDPEQIRRILVKVGRWEEDENIDLIRYKIPVDFSSKVAEEVTKIKAKAFEKEGREDLTDLDTFTIDGEETKDFDDALSIEFENGKILLGIHISDVSSWIKPETNIDLEARKRGISCYLPRRQIPMLPADLSHDFLSLKKGEKRLALSLILEMDPDGNILNHRFVPSIIEVKEQLTYDTVDKRLGKDKRFDELYRIASYLKKERIKKGALDISLPEVKIRFEGNIPVSFELIPQDTPAHVIVSEFMILYNWLIAKLSLKKGIPILFRTQEKPSEIIQKKEGMERIFYVLQQKRKIGPMSITTIPGPHSALGLDIYTHATSPLRRYLDLIVQRQVISFLKEGKYIYEPEELEKIRMEVVSSVKDVQIVTRNRFRYWTIKYLSMHIGESFDAIILDELKNKYRIVLCDFLILAEMKKKERILFYPGQRIKVRVKKADPWRDILEFEYEDKTK